ncbi:MAG: lipocalin-like domain-containing protein [Gemmatimonadota bacterium]|nr:lipocalin-like domain-containing protein [Gemmatimonadota bacterium]
MRRILRLVTVFAVIAAVTVACGTYTAEGDSGLEGAWMVTSWNVAGETVAEPQPGLIVFTDTHYSMMYVNGAAPRPQYAGEEMTDAEILAAFDSFTANSGRYEVSGNELTTRPSVAKDPNYMGTWPDNAETYTFELEGETLRLTWPSDWPGGLRIGTFRKVEGEAAS